MQTCLLRQATSAVGEMTIVAIVKICKYNEGARTLASRISCVPVGGFSFCSFLFSLLVLTDESVFNNVSTIRLAFSDLFRVHQPYCFFVSCFSMVALLIFDVETAACFPVEVFFVAVLFMIVGVLAS